MRTFVTRLFGPRMLLAVLATMLMGALSSVEAAPVSYFATLDGASESPPNASPGTGFTQVDIDAIAHTMHVHVEFLGLLGTNTACHIHGATAVPGTGTAGVATVTPTFTGFPGGVTVGVYDNTFDTTLASSWNAAYITAHGGTPAGAEAALFASIAAGTAYLNLHSTVVPGGEIRGFLGAGGPTPTANSSWGRIKSLYR